MNEARHLKLARDPGNWRVALHDGSTLVITAHGYSDEEGYYIFSLLMEGQPCFEMDIVRIPSTLVSQICGG